ncbi:response regulator [Bradyrhizobium cenepequi]
MPNDPTVYVIDDDDAARDALAFLLKTSGYSVQTFDSAVSFVESLDGLQRGYIITDVRMPGLSGVDLVRRLAAQKIDWPVIVITGHADVTIAIEALKAGAVDFIEKPCAEETLVAAISSAAAREGSDESRRDAHSGVQTRLTELSAAERQVLNGLSVGKSNAAIAAELCINARAVEVLRANVMTKMQARSLSHLVRMLSVAGL